MPLPNIKVSAEHKHRLLPKPDDGRVHFRVFLEKSTFCYINGHPKQYIVVDTIFNYILHFGLPGTCLYLSPQNTLLGAGGAGAQFLKTFS